MRSLGDHVAINYLSFVVRHGKGENAAVVNYLLSLLAEQVRGNSNLYVL